MTDSHDAIVAEIKSLRELIERDNAHIRETTERIEGRINDQNGRVRSLEIEHGILSAKGVMITESIEKILKRLTEDEEAVGKRILRIEGRQNKVIGASAALGAVAGVLGSWLKGFLS